MRITVNGEDRDVQDGATVAQILTDLNIRGERVAVEVNLDIIRREQRDERVLSTGDRVEIVSFVGGGK